MMDSGCDVHFTKNLCWITKDNGEGLDVIQSGGVFFVAARPTKVTPKNPGTLELNPRTAAVVEQAALASGSAAFGVLGPIADAALDGNGAPAVRIKVLSMPCHAHG